MRHVSASVGVVLLAAAAVAGPPLASASADPVADAAAPPPVTWSNVSTPPMSGDTSEKVYQDVTVIPGAGVWATGWTRHDLPGAIEIRTMVERNVGAGWSSLDTPDVETAPAADYMYGIDGTAADDVWAVGRARAAVGTYRSVPYAIHWDGASWTRATVPDPSGGFGADMSEVVALARDDVWAVGTAYPLEAKAAVYHFDGTSWSSYRIPRLAPCTNANYTSLLAVTATPAGDVYAGGECPTASGYAGFVAKMSSLKKWEVVARLAGSSSVVDMTADDDGTVWATGTQTVNGVSRPFLLYGSGTTWNRQLRPRTTDGTREQSHGVAVTPAGITMVGERNLSNGRQPWAVTWTPNRRWQNVVVSLPDSVTWLMTVAGSAGGPVWAMGEYLGTVGGKFKMVGFGATPGG